jgi:uncharacterized protein (DUF58 family)
MIPKELLKKIRRIEITTSHLVTDALAGRYQSAFKGRGMEFEEVRQYQPGDDVRTIDWNVSARSGEPFVKVYREERELTVLLVVDLSRSLEFGTRAQRKREVLAEIGATVAFSAIKNNDRIGLVLCTDRVEKFVPPRKGSGHVLRVIRELLAFEPEGRRTDLKAALEHVARIQRRRAVVFVLSDFEDAGYEHALRVLRSRHDVILVDVADRHEFELPKMGLVEFVDAETGERLLVDAGNAGWRRRFETAARKRNEARQKMFRQSRLDCIPVRTGEPFVVPLARFFRTREARR